VNSPVCTQQLIEAKETGKHFYPIWKEKATFNSTLEGLIYRRQLVDFTDPTKFRDSLASLVAGLKNIFDEKASNFAEAEGEVSQVDKSQTPTHPNIITDPEEVLSKKMKFLYICNDPSDHAKTMKLAVMLAECGFICCTYKDESKMVADLVDKCWAFLLILSTKSAASDFTRDQIAFAENRQKLILPILVQNTQVNFLDAAMTYTLARTPLFPFFVGDKKGMQASVDRLVSAINLATNVSENTEKVRDLREEVVSLEKKLSDTETELAQLRERIKKMYAEGKVGFLSL